MPEKNNKIDIINLSFAYASQPVLKDINISIKDKEIVTIIGPNGGGKTTLLRLILGLLQPHSGNVLINGKPAIESQKKIGYVPQHAHYDSHFPITVYEVVLSGTIKPFGHYSKPERVKVEKALEAVGLTQLKDRAFSKLSGGQIQRMLIARALVSDTDILLLDEPTSNIDPSGGNTLNTLLKELNKQITILLVTHDMGFVSNITNRVLCINKTLVEHPIDKEFSKVIASAYSNQSMIVRHETSLAGKPCTGGEDCD